MLNSDLIFLFFDIHYLEYHMVIKFVVTCDRSMVFSGFLHQ